MREIRMRVKLAEVCEGRWKARRIAMLAILLGGSDPALRRNEFREERKFSTDEGLTAEANVNRIRLASFEPNKTWCAAKEIRPGGSFGRAGCGPPQKDSFDNLFECARQAKFFDCRITTDLTLSRPTDGRLGVSAGGSGALCGAAAPGMPAERLAPFQVQFHSAVLPPRTPWISMGFCRWRAFVCSASVCELGRGIGRGSRLRSPEQGD